VVKVTHTEILELLHRYRTENAHRYPIVRLGVFGSVARNDVTAQSDVDVVVELEEPDLFVLIAIKQELEELLNRSVDIVRYRSQMSRALKQRIDAEAVYV
jgi:predicted nucleotidyltransferase